MFCLAITSCGLEEPYGGSKNNEGVIEFVARPVGFNNQTVETKTAASPGIETNIYSCYFLVFDTTPTNGGGDLVYCSDNLISGTDPVTSIPTQKINVDKKTVKKVRACFIVNVPKNFIYNETNNTPLINNLAALNDAVLGSDHFSYATHSADVPMGTPQMTINGVSNVKCIPAFGLTPTDINLEGGNTAPVSINIKRLFAKVSVNLQVQLNLSGAANNIQTLTHYELQKLNLYNLPTMVKLVEDGTNESAWRKTAGLYSATPMQKSDINTKIYNKTDLSSNLNLSYTYSFYVPEFYLNPKVNPAPTPSQEYKPVNFPNDGTNKAYPVFIELEGNFVKYSVNSALTTYKIYLGGNPIDDYSLSRNTHYVNDLTIHNTNKNISGSAEENTLDHRVSTTTINNPVAKAGKAANCYVISQPGDYRFPAYMGAYNNLQHAVPCEGGVDVEILVNKAQYEQTSISMINISNEAYDPVTNMISFSVAKAANVNLVPNGNVVIALVDKARTDASRKIIWSWHLWFCTDFSGGNESEWATVGAQTYPSGSKLMDRNLGATSATITLLNQNDAIGAYYIYGKKEPFIDGAYRGGGSIKDSNGNVVAQTWGSDTKSPTDPCPPGYHIPQSNVFAGDATKKDAPALGTFRFWDNNTTINTTDDIYFPYSGYIDEKNSKQTGAGVDSEYTTLSANNFQISDIRTNEEQIGDIQYNEVAYVIRYEEKELGYDEYRYSEFIYRTKLKTNKIGLYLSTNNTGVQYYVKESNWTDYQIVQCKRQKRQVKRKVQRFYEYKNTAGKWEWPKYEWVLSEDWREIVSPQAGDWTDDGIVTEQSNTYISSYAQGPINNDTWLNSLKSNQNSRDFEDMQERSSMNASYGYQVRCVKD